MPAGGEIGLDALLDSHSATPALPLALNIKADGLHRAVAEAVGARGIAEYFVFDMSIPDTLGYLRCGLRVFVRQSDIEPEPSLYREAAGIWLDCFQSDWITGREVEQHLSAGKAVCIVSPELHGRDPKAMWEKLARLPSLDSPALMLCTDRPAEAAKILGTSP
jgi:hypothetical protein